MFEYFGTSKMDRYGFPMDRFLLFDGKFPGRTDFLSGQEEVQNEIFRHLKGMAEEGRTDKLLLLHGPNGSSKTTVVNLIFRGLEHYSRTDEGAIYRLAWIFPKPHMTERQLGFTRPKASGEDEEDDDSFAFLEPDSVAAKIPCELRDPPIFLIPREERVEYLDSLMKGKSPESIIPSRFLEGDLSPKSKAIFEGLLTGYHGDWKKVIRHVQVERYFISRRFRIGAVTIDPQMHVDAGARQVTADHSLELLPPMLQNIRLIEPVGDLVDANCGALEYGDFLKRPLDMNKYLLNTIETGMVSLPGLLINLDMVFFGTTNENHLDAFKKSLDFTSFKARMELVQVPYLLQYSEEETIYRDVICAVARRRPILPHTIRVATLWAVLTRLQKPDRKNYSEEAGPLVERLTPLEKAKLYDHGEAPAGMKEEEKKILKQVVGEMRREFMDEVFFEGRFGASPREVKTILYEASHHKDYPCLSPLSVLDTIRDFVREKHVYDFLKLEPNGKYNDNTAFIDDVQNEYLGWVTAELESAMELVDESEYDRKCSEYFMHVVAFTRNEKVVNPGTGSLESPSDEIMATVEGLLDVQDPIEVFRENLVARIGAFRVDNPDTPVNYKDLFPDIFTALKTDFFTRRRALVIQIEEQLILHETGETSSILPKLKDMVDQTLRNLKERYGYCDEGLKEVILFVKKHRKLND